MRTPTITDMIDATGAENWILEAFVQPIPSIGPALMCPPIQSGIIYLQASELTATERLESWSISESCGAIEGRLRRNPSCSLQCESSLEDFPEILSLASLRSGSEELLLVIFLLLLHESQGEPTMSPAMCGKRPGVS